MSKLSENYIAVNEGKLSKSEFVRQARMSFPQHVSQFNSYDDAVKILRQRGLLSEDVVYQCKGDKFPLESIERGIDYELEQMGIYVPHEIPEPGDYRKAKQRAIDNLCKDPLYYLNKVACCCDKCNHTQEEAEKKKGKDYKQKKTEGGLQPVKPGQKKLQEAQVSKAAQTDEDNKTAEKLFMHFLANRKVKDGINGWKEKRNPQQILDSVRKKFPHYKPGKDLVKSFNLCWVDGKLGDQPAVGNAAYRGSHDVIHEGMGMKEEKLLKESITKTIKKVLAEAATANLAQLSDQNASVQNVPAILNNLENVVTEIESFIIKEQTKIQGIFDSIGDIKNEDNIPVGYKFAQPILDAFKKDLEPVLQKIDLENLKMPEAPEEDNSSLETNPEGLEPEMEPKQTMFTPRGEKPQPLAENKQPKRKYTA